MLVQAHAMYPSAPPITRSPDHGDHPIFSSPSKRFFQRQTLRRKKLGALPRDVHAVFQAYAEFSANVNPGFVAEAHIWGKQRSIAADQVGPFVSVQANAMAYAVREEFV